jgi:hypothetical protein
MPEGLHLVVIWTGRAADTASMLQRLAEMAADRTVDAALGTLADLARAGSDAFRVGRAASVLEVVDAFCEAMDAPAPPGLQIVSTDHDTLRRLARRRGATLDRAAPAAGS